MIYIILKSVPPVAPIKTQVVLRNNSINRDVHMQEEKIFLVQVLRTCLCHWKISKFQYTLSNLEKTKKGKKFNKWAFVKLHAPRTKV